MGKLTYKGFVPKDDPMFSTGPELYSRRESTPSSPTSASATDGAMPAKSGSVETEEQSQGLRIARFKHQNEQLKKQR